MFAVTNASIVLLRNNNNNNNKLNGRKTTSATTRNSSNNINTTTTEEEEEEDRLDNIIIINRKKTATKRRDVMNKFAFASLSSVLFLQEQSLIEPAYAILQGNDEDDEAFLAKAKSNRNQKLQQEREKQVKYAGEKLGRSTGDVAALQLAVLKISKAGSLIDQDLIYGAAAELETGNWEKELTKSAFGTDALTSALASLKKECSDGNASGAKKAYVSVANALKQTAKASDVASQLKFL